MEECFRGFAVASVKELVGSSGHVKHSKGFSPYACSTGTGTQLRLPVPLAGSRSSY